jgi:hypothetical protein
VASAILMELNIRLTVLVVETARLERRGVNDNTNWAYYILKRFVALATKLEVIWNKNIVLNFENSQWECLTKWGQYHITCYSEY